MRVNLSYPTKDPNKLPYGITGYSLTPRGRPRAYGRLIIGLGGPGSKAAMELYLCPADVRDNPEAEAGAVVLGMDLASKANRPGMNWLQSRRLGRLARVVIEPGHGVTIGRGDDNTIGCENLNSVGPSSSDALTMLMQAMREYDGVSRQHLAIFAPFPEEGQAQAVLLGQPPALNGTYLSWQPNRR